MKEGENEEKKKKIINIQYWRISKSMKKYLENNAS